MRIKAPKTKRGFRTIALDDATVELLLLERERHLRIQAGVADGDNVDLSLIKLPEDALMFPTPPARGADFSFSKPRDVRNFTRYFAVKVAELGFPDLRFHDLRGTHATLLLDNGVPVHTVADRVGDDPAVLLRNYAKRSRARKADVSVSDLINRLAILR